MKFAVSSVNNPVCSLLKQQYKYRCRSFPLLYPNTKALFNPLKYMTLPISLKLNCVQQLLTLSFNVKCTFKN